MRLTFHKERVMATPLTISCDAKCQREKNLELLKSEMVRTKGTPEYDQARIKYYTLLEGHGWLAKEKERIANNELDSVIQDYTSQYETMKKKHQILSAYSKFASDYQTDKDSKLKEINSMSSQTSVLNRLSQLSPIPSGFSVVSYIPILLDVLIGIMSLIILYMLYSKFMVTSPSPVEQIAGRRFSRRV